MLIKAPAKINLFLEVPRRRPDGYHDLVTLFARTGLCDTLRLRRAGPGIRLTVKNGPKDLGRPEDNIVYKAALKFFEAFRLAPAVKIELEKRIPVGAGLGGGSSDAAAALLGLARLYKVEKSGRARLMKIAASVGSDVPFFMLETRAAVGRGRGEKLRALTLKGRLPRLLLVYPGAPVYTKEVYGNLKVAPPAEVRRRLKDFGRLRRLLRAGKLAPADAGLLFNRLEDPVLPRHKAVRLARERLLRLGADAVMMSGSGATVFALCWRPAAAVQLARAAACIRGYRVFLTKFW